MTASKITVKVGKKEYALDSGIARVALKERILEEFPDIKDALKEANIGVDLAPELAPEKTKDGKYKFYIDGEWVEPKGKTFHDNLNPADKSEVLGKVGVATPEEVDRAMKAADRDFAEWMYLSGDIRSKIFYRVVEHLKENKPALEQIMCREMGKTIFDCHLDIAEAIGVVEAVAPMGINMKGHTYQKNVNGTAMECRLSPRGVAAIITPFNFPLAIPIAQVVSALVTGNPVIFKPSHLTPEISHAMVKIIVLSMKEIGEKYNVKIPKGVLSMFTGGGSACSSHPVVKTIHFTGSKEIGDKVDAIASALGKRVMKEVAGINIFYVHKDADLERASNNFIYGKTITGGQRCSSIQEAIIDAQVYEKFIEIVLKKVKNIVTGPGYSKEVMDADATPGKWSLPPVADEEQYNHIKDLLDRAVKAGGKIRYQDKLPKSLTDKGFFFPFTLIENIGKDNPLFSEEIFGPVGVLTKVKDVYEAIDYINNKIGIVACIDSKDKNTTEYFIERVLRTRIDDGRHGTGCFWATKFGGDRGAGSGNAALDTDMVYGYVIWKTIYRSFKEPERG